MARKRKKTKVMIMIYSLKSSPLNIELTGGYKLKSVSLNYRLYEALKRVNLLIT